ncbi:hypothetical protein VTJ49DRAFT_1756 [Mycothermus thermophilus]|uniref:GH16 domain-containing protein n=1 Tax=Humicola insolens TaxID=85995 RepID=A0ABR3VR35_HUMIN
MHAAKLRPWSRRSPSVKLSAQINGPYLFLLYYQVQTRENDTLPRLPSALSSVILLLSVTAPLSARAERVLADDDSCECYLINNDQGTYYTHHRFFDFRNLSEYAGVPPVIRDAASSARAEATSDYFLSDEWKTFWMLNTWNNSASRRADATVAMVNSPNNVYIEASTEATPTSHTWLTLRTQRLAGFQTAAEFETISDRFKYLSIRMRARTVGAPGAITALFTYRTADTLAEVQEADLEIRTSDPRDVLHYTNQPSYTEAGDVIPGATINTTMPGGREWTSWATHRLDWTPGRTTWYVDGEETASSEFQAPRDESTIIVNAWSDGGIWTGNMSRFDAAYLQVQWIELVFNSTARRNGPGGDEVSKKKVRRGGERGCKVVCSIDETPLLGTPVLLWESGAARRLRDGGIVAWVPRAVVLVTVLVATGLVG